MGLFGLIDPPRPEAIAAIAQCQSAGIRIKMITGDHALTARAPNAPILSGFLLWRIAFVSLIIVAGTFGLFLRERSRGADTELARTVAVNTLVVFEVFYLLNARYILAPAYTLEGLSGNRFVLLAIALVIVFQVLFTHAPFMQHLFGTSTGQGVDDAKAVPARGRREVRKNKGGYRRAKRLEPKTTPDITAPSAVTVPQIWAWRRSGRCLSAMTSTPFLWWTTRVSSAALSRNWMCCAPFGRISGA